MEEQSPIVTAIISAAQEASKAASEAVAVARDVANRAEVTANRAAEATLKMQESSLLQGQDITYIKAAIIEIKTLVENKYVTLEQFNSHKKDDALVKNVVLGFCGLVLAAFVGALITGHIK